MNKLSVILILISLSFSSFSQEISKKDYENFKSYFVSSDLDTLHIFPSMVENYSDNKIIPSILLFNETIFPESDTVFAISSFPMDSAKIHTAYLVGISRESQIGTYLLIYSEKENKFIYDILTSSYNYIESSAEINRNTWIIDANNDKNLDIAVIEDIIDFEFPTKDSPNISGTIFRLYTYSNGEYVNTTWPENFLLEFKLIK